MPIMIIHAFRLVPILLLTTSVFLFNPTADKHPEDIRSIEKLRNKFDKEPFDSPYEAQEFYKLKRVPVGETAIPVERYLTASDQMKQMAEYSTAMQSYGPTLGTWTQLGPGNIGGRTRALIIDKNNPNLMYAGGVAGGIWKSTNAGASWVAKDDMLPNLAIGCMAIDPNNSSILYAGTGEGFCTPDAVRGAGIYKSTNAGESWTLLIETDRSRFYYVNDIVVSPVNSQRVYAAARTGVWRSTDAGVNWSRVLNPDTESGCLDLVIRTDQTTDYIFASCGSFPQPTIQRNTNAGGSGTWTTVYTETGMGRVSLAIAPSNQSIVYALAQNVGGGTYNGGLLAVFRSTSNGDSGSWTAQVRNTNPTKLNTVLLTNPAIAFYGDCQFQPIGPNEFLNQGCHDNVIAVDPIDSNRVWAGGIDLFRSDDGGANWGMASHWWAIPGSNPRYAHADQHAIVFHPNYNGTSNKVMFVSNDGGIFRTDDARAATATGPGAPCSTQNGGVTWTSLNNNYGVTQFYHGVPYPNGVSYFGGTQDNGTVRGTDTTGIGGWSTLLGGDGGYVAVDRTNTNTVYAENTNLSFKKSFNDGIPGTWFNAVNGISPSIDPSGNFLFIAPFTMDPSNSQRLWIGGQYLWRTVDGASN